jgi:HTH-type transcriptional regulator/antitoxin HigA
MPNTTTSTRRLSDRNQTIRNEQDLAAAFKRLDVLWGAKAGTQAGDELEVLTVLIEKYEDAHYPMPICSPLG